MFQHAILPSCQTIDLSQSAKTIIPCQPECETVPAGGVVIKAVGSNAISNFTIALSSEKKISSTSYKFGNS